MIGATAGTTIEEFRRQQLLAHAEEMVRLNTEMDIAPGQSDITIDRVHEALEVIRRSRPNGFEDGNGDVERDEQGESGEGRKMLGDALVDFKALLTLPELSFRSLGTGPRV